MTASAKHLSPDRQIWAIAGPAIIAGSSAPMVGLVDTWAIGHLNSASHLAAISVGGTVFSFVFWAFGFLRMGTTGLVAQTHGRAQTSSDPYAMARLMIRSLMLALMIGLSLILLQNGLTVLAIEALAPPESVKPLAESYITVRIWSAPAVMFIYGINGYLIGVARAKTSLLLQLVLNISNAALNLLFVLGFNMGVVGVALGSLIAEWLTAIVGIAILVNLIGWQSLLNAIKDKATWVMAKFKRILSVNGYIFVRTLFLMAALSLITRTAGTMGEDALAASHVLSTFLLLISLGLDGFAYAAEALAGKAAGASDRRTFRFWAVRTSYWAGGVSILYAIVFYLFGDAITAGLTDLMGVRAAVHDALPVLAALPVIAVACYQYDGIMIGATAAKEMMQSMGAAFVVYLIVLNPMANTYGIIGLWGAVAVFMGARGLVQAMMYNKIERRIAAAPVSH